MAAGIKWKGSNLGVTYSPPRFMFCIIILLTEPAMSAKTWPMVGRKINMMYSFCWSFVSMHNAGKERNYDKCQIRIETDRRTNNKGKV